MYANREGVRVGAAYLTYLASISSLGTLVDPPLQRGSAYAHEGSSALGEHTTSTKLKLPIVALFFSCCGGFYEISLIFLIINWPSARIFKMLPRPLRSFRAVANRRTRGSSYGRSGVQIRRYLFAVSTLVIWSKGPYSYTPVAEQILH